MTRGMRHRLHRLRPLRRGLIINISERRPTPGSTVFYSQCHAVRARSHPANGVVTFAEATAVEPTGGDRYSANIAPGWDVLGNANGGYLLAVAARAASEAAEGRLPVSITGHFLAPGRPGPVTLTTHIEKRGRRYTTVRATMSDATKHVLSVLGSFADLPDEEHPVVRVETRPPELPPVTECIPVAPTDTFPPPFMGKIDLRLHPEDALFNSGVPRFRGWFRLLDDEPIDAFGLLVAVDAFPPTAFNAQLPIAWTPTLELTTHIRRQAVAGWLRCQFRTRFISDGFVEEDGEVWDGSGRLVAQSRQLALVARS